MTVAPYASPTRRIAVTGLLSALMLVLGVLALREYGVGAALFLLSLAAVGLVDLVQVLRRPSRRGP